MSCAGVLKYLQTTQRTPQITYKSSLLHIHIMYVYIYMYMYCICTCTCTCICVILVLHTCKWQNNTPTHMYMSSHHNEVNNDTSLVSRGKN